MDPMCNRDFPRYPSASGSGEVLYLPPLFLLSCHQNQELATKHPVTSPTMRSPPPLPISTRLMNQSTCCFTFLFFYSTALPTQKHSVSCVGSRSIGRVCSTPGFNNHTSGKRWTLCPLRSVCKLKKRLNFKQLLHFRLPRVSLEDDKGILEKHDRVREVALGLLFPRVSAYFTFICANTRDQIESFSFLALETDIPRVNA